MFRGTVLSERNGINGTDRILTGNGTDWNGTEGMNTTNGTDWNGTNWNGLKSHFGLELRS